MKRLNCNVLMLNEALVIFFYFRCYFYSVACCTTALLLNVGAEPQSLCSTTRVSSLVAAKLELRFLRVIPAIGELTPNK